MKSTLSLAVLALATSSIAGAAELKPLEGGSFTLGDHAVSIYYTAHDQDYQVVTTIAPEAGVAGAPIRFVGLMQPGQSGSVSVGAFDTTNAPEVLELVHTGDRLSVVQTIDTASAD